MRKPLLVIVGAVLVAACGSKEPATTPEGSFYAYQRAMVDRDWSAVWHLIAPSRKATAEERWKEGGDIRKDVPGMAKELGKTEAEVGAMTIEALFVADAQRRYEEKKKSDPDAFAQEMEKFENAGILEADRIGDDEARVFYMVGEKKRLTRFILEGGKWYVDRNPFPQRFRTWE